MSNIDEATAARARMTMAEEAFALAKPYEIGNHLSEALAIAQLGYPENVGTPWQVGRVNRRLGNRETTGCYSRLQASSFQSINGSHILLPISGTALNQTCCKPYVNLQRMKAKVDIFFLYEGLLDDAIQAVRTVTTVGASRHASSGLPIRLGGLKRLSNGQNRLWSKAN